MSALSVGLILRNPSMIPRYRAVKEMLTLDKISFSFGVLTGIIIGLILSYLLLIFGLGVVGSAFQVQSMNVNVSLNETMWLDSINQSINNAMIQTGQ